MPLAMTVSNCVINTVARVLTPFGWLYDGASCREVTLNDSGLSALEVVPPNVREDRVMLYFHGGAHIMFSPYTHRELLGRLALNSQTRVVAVNYRKAPKDPFPAGLEDALSAWQWVSNQYPQANVVVGGDSAGGNLTFALLVRLAQLNAPQPAAAFGFSPWLLLNRAAGWWATKLYMNGHSAEDPLISPALASRAIAAKMPPFLIHAADDEGLRVDAEVMTGLCRGSGVPVELQLYSGCMHDFQYAPLLYPEACKDSLERLTVFLDRHWEAGKTGKAGK